MPRAIATTWGAVIRTPSIAHAHTADTGGVRYSSVEVRVAPNRRSASR